MKYWILAALTGAALSGCVAPQIAPQEGVLGSVRNVSVVPIESPPLFLHPKTAEDRAAVTSLMKSAESPIVGVAPGAHDPGASPAQREADWLGHVPPIGSKTTTTAAAIGGMLLLLEAASSGKDIPGESGTVVRGRAPVTWVPSIEFAKTAASLLQRNETLDVQTLDGYVRLPIADRSITWHLENWMEPIREWYGSDEPGVDYASRIRGEVDLVVEVGVLNYEYNFGRLILQVWVRLIDPNTRQVLGRARSFEQLKAQPLAPLLENGAEEMKRLLSEMGNRLVAECLTDVGLSSR